MAIAKTPYRQRSHGIVAYSWLMTITKELIVSIEQGKEAIQDVDTTSRSFESKIYRRSCLEPLPPPQSDTASIIMVRETFTHQVRTSSPAHLRSDFINKGHRQTSLPLRTKSPRILTTQYRSSTAPIKRPTAPYHQRPRTVAKIRSSSLVVEEAGTGTVMRFTKPTNVKLGLCRSGWSRRRAMSHGAREAS